MNPDGLQIYEFVEYIVEFSPQRIFRNTDLIEVFGTKLDETWSNTKIEPYQVQHLMPSASANEMFIGQ